MKRTSKQESGKKSPLPKSVRRLSDMTPSEAARALFSAVKPPDPKKRKAGTAR